MSRAHAVGRCMSSRAHARQIPSTGHMGRVAAAITFCCVVGICALIAAVWMS